MDDAAYLDITTADGNVHVLPVSLVQDWIDGEQQIADSDDWELIVRRICAEWLRDIQGGPAFVEFSLGEPNGN